MLACHLLQRGTRHTLGGQDPLRKQGLALDWDSQETVALERGVSAGHSYGRRVRGEGEAVRGEQQPPLGLGTHLLRSVHVHVRV